MEISDVINKLKLMIKYFEKLKFSELQDQRVAGQMS